MLIYQWKDLVTQMLNCTNNRGMKYLTSSKLSLLLIILISFSCEREESLIAGGWYINDIEFYNGEIESRLFVNFFSLKKDHSCTLPIENIEDDHSDKREGTWKTQNTKEGLNLEIRSSNTFFNNTYKVLYLKKLMDEQSGGYYVRMIIKSDSLKLDCVRQFY